MDTSAKVEDKASNVAIEFGSSSHVADEQRDADVVVDNSRQEEDEDDSEGDDYYLKALLRQDTGASGTQSRCPRRMLRQASTFLCDASEKEEGGENHLDVDDERLQNAMEDAGKYAYGIAAIELWELNEETGRLCRPGSSAGWVNTTIATSDTTNEHIRRLFDTTHPGYIEPKEIFPGVDLPGKLFSESSLSTHDAVKTYLSTLSSQQETTKRKHHSDMVDADVSVDDSTKSWSPGGSRKTFAAGTTIEDARKMFAAQSHTSSASFRRSASSSFRRSVASFRGLPKTPTNHNNNHSNHTHHHNNHAGLLFRDIHSLVIDPDTLKTPRLEVLEQAGFVQAAGVPFSKGYHQGIIIYYTNISTSDEANYESLTSIANQVYLFHAAETIASIYSSAEARRASLALKLYKDLHSSKRTNHRRPTTATGLSTSKDIGDMDVPKHRQAFRHWFHVYWNKCTNLTSSGDVQIPPAMPWDQCFVTFCGVLISLLIILGIDYYVLRYLSGNVLFFLSGPIGALMTLQYGLTGAPASQPRNVILSPLLVGMITIPFSYIPEEIMAKWIRQSIAPAFSIAAMAKCGVLHPPAGGMSIILASSSTFGWEFIAATILAGILSFVPAILINNLSQKRQYPTYWGYFVKYLPHSKKHSPNY